jgi:hypothetical protein
VRRADKPTTFMFQVCLNLGATKSWFPPGLIRVVQGSLYIYWDYQIKWREVNETCGLYRNSSEIHRIFVSVKKRRKDHSGEIGAESMRKLQRILK